VHLAWAEAPGPLTVKLLFRVGTHDGLSPLAERRVRSTLWGRDVLYETSPGRLFTSVRLTGEPDEVWASVDVTCAALAAPTPGLEERARRSLAACPRGSTFVGDLIEARFGPSPEISGDGWFTLGNVAVWMTAEPPADFALPLPDGARKPVEPVRPRPGPLPRRDDFPAIDGVAGWSPAAHVAAAVLEARLAGLLRGFVPHVIVTRLDADLAHVFAGCPCPPGAAQHVRGQLEAALAAPPTPDELVDHPTAAPTGLDRLDHEARCALIGRAPDHEAVDADAVEAVLAALRASRV